MKSRIRVVLLNWGVKRSLICPRLSCTETTAVGTLAASKPCVRSASHLFKGNNLCFRHGPPVLFGDVSERFHSLGGASRQYVKARTLRKPLCNTERLSSPPVLFWAHRSIINVPTLLKIRKIAIGTADSPSSHLQPRVGIISSANRISNMEPKPQNSWSTQTRHARDYRWLL